MRYLILTMLLAFAAQGFATELYRWVDAEGRVHYSDRPHAGADKVEVRTPSTFKAPPAAALSAPEQPDEQLLYSAVSILSPERDQTFWNTGGLLSVSVRVEPGLRPGDRVNVYLNGTRVTQGAPGRVQFQLTGVVRGTHQLVAAVERQDGRELKRSDPVSFHVHQRSVRAP